MTDERAQDQEPEVENGNEDTESPPSRRRFGVGRFTARALLWLTAGVALLGFVLLRTALGNRVLLEWGLDRAEANVAGSIEVGDIRSANLLRGARLLDVQLLTPEGDTLLVADSVEASYSIRGILAGELGLAGVHVWGGRFDLTRRSPGTPSTLGAWLASPAVADSLDEADPDPDQPAAEGPGFPGFTISGIRLTESGFRLRLPTDLPAGGVTRVDTVGGRRLALDVLVEQARVPRLRIGGRDQPTEIEVAEASAQVDILRQPLFIDRLEASVTVADGQVAVQLANLVTAQGQAEGTVAVSLDPTSEALVDIVLAIDDLDSRDLGWINPGIPPLTGTSRVIGQVRRSGSRWTADAAELDWDGADVRGGGTVVLENGGLRMQAIEVRTSGVAVDDLERWLPEPLRVGGRVGGRVALDGTPSRMELDGEVTWTTPRAQPVVLRGGGAVTGLGSTDLGFDAFSAIVGPFEWAALRRSGGLPLPLDGPGYMAALLNGSLETGLGISGEVRHFGGVEAPVASRVLVYGTMQSREGVLGLDLSADLQPLALAMLRTLPDSGLAQPLPLSGTLTGTVDVSGDLERLTVVADVSDGTGDVSLTTRFSPQDPVSDWSVEGVVAQLSGDLFTSLGPDTRLTGEISASGSGASLLESRVTMSAALEQSRVSGLNLDSLVVRGRLDDGILGLDALRGTVGGFALDAQGTLAVADSMPAGTIEARFETESLIGLRSAFLGDSILARPEDGLARRALEAEGIDPDTLPSQEQVAWDGAVRGRATLVGSLESFALTGSAIARNVQIGPNRIDSLTLAADGVDLPGADLRVAVELAADSLNVFDRFYSAAGLTGSLGRQDGDFTLDVARGEQESYRGGGSYEIDGLLRTVRVDDLSARFDSLQYELQRPATLAWGDSALTVGDVEVRRLGPDPVVIRADGRLPTRGDVSFDLSIEGLYLERLTQVLQREDIDVAGRVDLEATIGGLAAEPTINATVHADSLRWRRLEVAGLDGRIDYIDRVAEVEFRADRGGEVVLDVAGEIPVDLSLTPGTERISDRELSIVARATDLPARATVAPLEDLENVEGLVSGSLELAGTVDDPQASGSLRLEGGAWTVGSLGVRHTDVSGTAVLGADNVLDVDVTAQAEGNVTVDGTITLNTLTDPTFDLEFDFDRFLGVDRRDIRGVFSGQAYLTGTYRSPDVGGTLDVDQGTIFLDEFTRNAQVVDLNNTRLTGLLGNYESTRLLQVAGNPFMNGLRTDITLGVRNNTRLSGRDLDIEMVGDVTMVFDRRARDLALVGELTARRGTYNTLGRTFQVQSGTIGFIGTPGVNPELDITATTRVRRQEFGDLTVTANVVGTLVEWRVLLSADEETYGESDIISYLITGQPSTGITSSLAGSSSDAGALALSTGVSLAAGSIVSRIGAFAAQQTDIIDYLAITGVSDAASASVVGGASTLGNTQVEVGRYFAGGDVFGALVLGAGTLGTQPVRGARVEWQSSDQFHVEAFFEDRFLRVASVGLAELGAGSAYIFGFSLVREWGY